MLNVFTSFAAVNEAVSGGAAAFTANNIPEYNFEGLSVVEAFQECCNQTMIEAANFDEFAIGADEMIVEAAMSNPYNVEVLTEAAANGIWDKLKRLIDKLISMVKGLLTKLRAFFAKFFGKTESWCKLVEPKVKTAKPDSELTYAMWDWDEGYVGSAISDGARKLFEAWKTQWADRTIDSMITASQQMYAKHKGDSPDADTDFAKEFDDVLGKKREDLGDTLTADMEAAFGVTAASMDEVRVAIVRKAHGDTDSKNSAKKIAGSMNSMFSYVKESKKTIEKIEKTYKDNLTTLTNFRKKLDKTLVVKDAGSDDKNSSTASAIVREANKAVQTVSAYTSAYQNAISNCSQLNVSLVQEMVKEYMNAVTKCINSKAVKK